MTVATLDPKVRDAVSRVEKATADREIRICRRIEIGHCVQQGDLYIFRVADNHPRGTVAGVGEVQLAQGTSNGARHVAEGEVKVFAGVALPDGVKPPMDVDAAEITGPLIVASKTWHVRHPEHPHHRLPAGTYQVTHQFDPKTMRRVVD